MDDWFSKIESDVFTYVETVLDDDTIHCTTKSQDAMPDTFPTLYLHELSPIEQGQDLDNQTVNAVLSTIEIQVWSNKTEKQCKDILTKAILIMKQLRYNVIAFPDVQTTDNVSWGVARFRRMIGNGDTLY